MGDFANHIKWLREIYQEFEKNDTLNIFGEFEGDIVVSRSNTCYPPCLKRQNGQSKLTDFTTESSD
jgi:hypothetical protein